MPTDTGVVSFLSYSSLNYMDDVKASRTYGILYTNTLSYPLFVNIIYVSDTTDNTISLTIDGILVSKAYCVIAGYHANVSGWILPGKTYQFNRSQTNGSVVAWIEWGKI